MLTCNQAFHEANKARKINVFYKETLFLFNLRWMKTEFARSIECQTTQQPHALKRRWIIHHQSINSVVKCVMLRWKNTIQKTTFHRVAIVLRSVDRTALCIRNSNANNARPTEVASRFESSRIDAPTTLWRFEFFKKEKNKYRFTIDLSSLHHEFHSHTKTAQYYYCCYFKKIWNQSNFK